MPAAASTRRKPKETSTKAEDGFKPILDIDLVVPDKSCVRLRTKQHPDGKLYELVSIKEFGIAKQHRFLRDANEFGLLWNKEPDELTDNEADRMKMLLDRLFDQVLDAPASVKAQATDIHRHSVVQSFLSAPMTTRPQTTN